MSTPYGKPSDQVTIGEFGGRRIAFIPRHGKNHTIPPHMINFRANIWAFKELGVKRIIAPSAVGSLKEEVRPADLALPDQFIDFTKRRVTSFADEGHVIHISAADPFCPQLHSSITEAASKAGVTLHQKCTYVCIEGPRFSTRAESRFFRTTGADIIGMTLVPECSLAREAQICYASIAMVTDYDVWADKPVSAAEVLETMRGNVEHVRDILRRLMGMIPEERMCQCGHALDEAEY